MDYWKKDRFTDYFLTMANAEANELISVAKTVSLIHLNDGFVRMEFQDNVQAFINAQMGVIRSGGSDKASQECIQNLKQEREYLTIQDRMLCSGQAAIHTSIKLVKNGEIWGYIINGNRSCFERLAGSSRSRIHDDIKSGRDSFWCNAYATRSKQRIRGIEKY